MQMNHHAEPFPHRAFPLTTWEQLDSLILWADLQVPLGPEGAPRVAARATP